MTPQDHRTLVNRWFSKARRDLEGAEFLFEQDECPSDTICTLAQQAAEKAIKTILVQVQVDFPKTHDLEELSNLLPDEWRIDIPGETLDALARWAIEARYPGDWEDPSTQDAAEALNSAIAVWDAVCTQFERHGVRLA